MLTSNLVRRTGLVVEDDADLRSLMVELLDEAGMETMECDSAEAALALMLIHGRKIVVVLTDVQLPGPMDGLDFAREIKLRWPSLPVVLTSGHGGERLAGLPSNCIFLPKPWRGEEIVKLVEQALALADRRTPFGR
jgi:DNA-binding NtrC family response regulator